jgi:hypothetical protein
VSPQPATAEILALHRADHVAHFQHDIAALLSGVGDELIDMRDGNINTMTRADIESRFKQYFASAKFLAWDDMEKPIIHASPDGKMAWMVVKVHIKYEDVRHDNRVDDSVLAWMAAYEKINGHWVMQAVATTTAGNP